MVSGEEMQLFYYDENESELFPYEMTVATTFNELKMWYEIGHSCDSVIHNLRNYTNSISRWCTKLNDYSSLYYPVNFNWSCL